MATQWLDQHNVKYELVDVTTNQTAFDEMVRLSGQTRTPVIEVDDQILADFGPDELEQFWNSLTKNRER